MNELGINIEYKRLILRCILVDILFAASYVFNISIISYIALVALLFVLIISNSEEHVFLYITLMPLLSSVKLGSTQILFVFVGFSIIKFLYQHRKMKTTLFCVLSIFYVLTIEILFDCFSWKMGQFLNLFVVIAYCLLLMAAYPWDKTDYTIYLNFMIYVGLFCIALTLFSTVVNGESLTTYVSATETYVRFGESESSHSLGGAMGIPIYAMVTTACCYIKFINEKSSILKKLIYIAIVLGCIFFGLLTHSRNFVLGLVGFIVVAVLATLIKRNNIKGVFLMALLLLVGIFIAIRNQDWISNILNLFETRGTWQKDIRVRVWNDCFRYWGTHFLSLIFGAGTKNYTFVGAQQGYLFYMCAHNIVLDCLMSWGIIGLILFGGLIRNMYMKAKDNLKFRDAILFFVPLLTWFIMKMTSGTFEDGYEYFFIIALVNIAAHNVAVDQEEKVYELQ